MNSRLSHSKIEPSTNDDRGSLKLLAIFYCVFGALGLVGGLGIGITNSDNLAALGGAILCSGIFMMLLGSGLSMLYHRYRIFSLIAASITCLGFPAGTVLGIWTIVVLRRPGVKQIYLERQT